MVANFLHDDYYALTSITAHCDPPTTYLLVSSLELRHERVMFVVLEIGQRGLLGTIARFSATARRVGLFGLFPGYRPVPGRRRRRRGRDARRRLLRRPSIIDMGEYVSKMQF